MIKKIFCLTLCLKSACALHEHGKENGLFLLDMLEGSGRVRTIVRDDGMGWDKIKSVPLNSFTKQRLNEERNDTDASLSPKGCA